MALSAAYPDTVCLVIFCHSFKKIGMSTTNEKSFCLDFCLNTIIYCCWCLLCMFFVFNILRRIHFNSKLNNAFLNDWSRSNLARKGMPLHIKVYTHYYSLVLLKMAFKSVNAFNSGIIYDNVNISYPAHSSGSIQCHCLSFADICFHKIPIHLIKPFTEKRKVHIQTFLSYINMIVTNINWYIVSIHINWRISNIFRHIIDE